MKLQEVPSWISRRDMTPTAIGRAISRAYWRLYFRIFLISFEIIFPFIRWNFKYCLPKYCGLTPFVQVQYRIKYKWHASFRVTQLIYV